LRDWVFRGGTLYICGANELGREFQESGFGRTIALPSPDLDIDATANAVKALDPSLPTQLTTAYTRDRATWDAFSTVGEIKVNVPLLIGFMALFAIVAGPLNLYLFAPSGRRHRLFWTTPVISLAASVILIVAILLQDGFGGSGTRTALIYVIPSERKQVVLQEQLSRTGVVRSSRFDTAEPAFIAPIDLQNRVFSSSRRRQYENIERSFSGDWFTSRALQAHWIETVGSTRADVALLNASELQERSVAPVVLSSISARLNDLVYFDEHRQTWHAANVHPGEKIVLQKMEQTQQLLPKIAGPRLRAGWEKVANIPGYFYALSTDGTGLIDTLPSIRWHDQRVLYVGRVSTNAQP
jgi:hypothetical protein